MELFTFEHSFKFDEKKFVQLNSLFIRKNRPVRIGLIFVTGIACLFWKYTLMIGIIIVALTILALFMEKLIPKTAANNFEVMRYLHTELTYGVSEKNLWVKGEQLFVTIGWELVVTMEEREGWLRISANSTPSMWFQIAQLKQEHIYDNVIGLCKKHGIRYS